MSKVFVVDAMQRPLDPVHPGWARKLLSSGQAAVFRRFPFTLILKKEVEHPDVSPLRIKLDPGSTTTGLALVDDAKSEIVFAAEVSHRGQTVSGVLQTRRAIRRSRRQRHTRYRKPRFANRRTKRPGWLPPSQLSRISNVLTWVQRLSRLCPLTACSEATGRGSRQMCRMDKYGFPRTGPKGAKSIKGFRTGNMVKAVVTQGAKRGRYVGRVAVRATGSPSTSGRSRGRFRVSAIALAPCCIVGTAIGMARRPFLPCPEEGTPDSSPWVKPMGFPGRRF